MFGFLFIPPPKQNTKKVSTILRSSVPELRLTVRARNLISLKGGKILVLFPVKLRTLLGKVLKDKMWKQDDCFMYCLVQVRSWAPLPYMPKDVLAPQTSYALRRALGSDTTARSRRAGAARPRGTSAASGRPGSPRCSCLGRPNRRTGEPVNR